MALNLAANWLCPFKKNGRQYKVGTPETINTIKNRLSREDLYVFAEMHITITRGNYKEKHVVNLRARGMVGVGGGRRGRK